MISETETKIDHLVKGFTHVVQVTDKIGHIISRDPFKSKAEAEERAVKLREQGQSVDVSTMDALRTDGFYPLKTSPLSET